MTNCEKRAIGSNGGFGYKALKEGIEIANQYISAELLQILRDEKIAMKGVFSWLNIVLNLKCRLVMIILKEIVGITV